MTREFLKKLGLESDAIDQIMDENGKDIEKAKGNSEESASRVKELEKEVESLKGNIKKLPNHNYTYSNGINSYGASISAPYMGNALHTDTNKPVANAKKTTSNTTKAASAKKAKTSTKKVTQYLTQAQLDKWFAALKKEYENALHSKYEWVDPPTYKNSHTKSTCIAEHSVAMQLLGVLPKGGYFYYHPTKHRIAGNKASYVKKHTELFKLWYPNKNLTTMAKKGTLQPGDMVGFGNPGYHSMVYMGLNSKGKPIFASLGHGKKYKQTYPYYANRKVNMVVRLKKVAK